MCGIFGYIGKNNDVMLGLEGLKRLEYRGYDSAGIAAFDASQNEIITAKAVGKVGNLFAKVQTQQFSGAPMILHTRWATHGVPSEQNAHPHHDCRKNIHLVHNGIVENYRSLKEELQREGHEFTSETDTEVAAHLVEKFFKGNLEDAVRQALLLVSGTFAFAIISKEDAGKIVLARRSSPLLVGVGEGEYFAASDPAAVVGHTNKVIFLEDNDIAVLTKDGVKISHLFDNHSIDRHYVNLDWDWEEASKSGYPHYMLKEIFEVPEVIVNTLRGRLLPEEGNVKLGGLGMVKDKLRDIQKLILCGCGTAFYAGLTGEYMLEEYAQIPTEVEFGSEFRYRKPVLDPKTAFIAVSQSGETADTLASLKEAKEKGILTLGVVNVVGSTIARETEAGVYNHAGPEIAVASTKALISQLVVLALITVMLGRQRDLSQVTGERIIKELSLLPEKAKTILAFNEDIRRLASKYYQSKDFFYLGRKYNFPSALEGALKLKEISYVHAEGYGAGEMKHGPIALIDEDFPTFAIALSDSVYEKMISNIQEIKARGGKVIALATEGNEEIKQIADDVIYVPKTIEMLSPILSVIPMQLFAYHMGVLRGCDVDKPRNLAKSVTVE